MNTMHARFIIAAVMLLLLAAITKAHAARPMPVDADVVITFAGQSFGFAGPLRYFEATDAGGQVVLDPRTLESAPDVPLEDVDVATLDARGNTWQVLAYVNHSVAVFTGTCAVESFRSTEAEVSVLHVYLRCADLDT
jgi:hypothetical protein